MVWMSECKNVKISVVFGCNRWCAVMYFTWLLSHFAGLSTGIHLCPETKHRREYNSLSTFNSRLVELASVYSH